MRRTIIVSIGILLDSLAVILSDWISVVAGCLGIILSAMAIRHYQLNIELKKLELKKKEEDATT